MGQMSDKESDKETEEFMRASDSKNKGWKMG